MKLFCFTYAGGSADFYKDMAYKLSNVNITLCALEYPGHGRRRSENCANSFTEMTEDMVRQMVDCLEKDEEYCLMGYSMGCLTAVEVLKNLVEKQKVSLPKHIFLAAHEPKTVSFFSQLEGKQLDAVIKARTISLGGVPEELIRNQTFWRMYLPIYRSDYQLISDFNFETFNFATQIPATVFYAEKDTPFQEMVQWNRYFVGELRFYEFSGNHFFIREHMEQVANIVKQRMMG